MKSPMFYALQNKKKKRVLFDLNNDITEIFTIIKKLFKYQQAPNSIGVGALADIMIQNIMKDSVPRYFEHDNVIILCFKNTNKKPNPIHYWWVSRDCL